MCNIINQVYKGKLVTIYKGIWNKHQIKIRIHKILFPRVYTGGHKLKVLHNVQSPWVYKGGQHLKFETSILNPYKMSVDMLMLKHRLRF